MAKAFEEAPACAQRMLAAVERVPGVRAGYFRTLGIALLRGRDFTESEAAARSVVRQVVIDTALAQRLWPSQDPIGRPLQWVGGRAAGRGGPGQRTP